MEEIIYLCMTSCSEDASVFYFLPSGFFSGCDVTQEMWMCESLVKYDAQSINPAAAVATLNFGDQILHTLLQHYYFSMYTWTIECNPIQPLCHKFSFYEVIIYLRGTICWGFSCVGLSNPEKITQHERQTVLLSSGLGEARMALCFLFTSSTFSARDSM